MISFDLRPKNKPTCQRLEWMGKISGILTSMIPTELYLYQNMSDAIEIVYCILQWWNTVYASFSSHIERQYWHSCQRCVRSFVTFHLNCDIVLWTIDFYSSFKQYWIVKSSPWLLNDANEACARISSSKILFWLESNDTNFGLIFDFRYHFCHFRSVPLEELSNQPTEATSVLWKLDELALISHDVHFDLMDCFFLSIHFIDYNCTEFCKITINYNSVIKIFCYVYDVYPCNDQSGIKDSLSILDTSMLVTDVEYEIFRWQVWYFADGFGRSGHYSHYSAMSSETDIQKLSSTLSRQHHHVTNITNLCSLILKPNLNYALR